MSFAHDDEIDSIYFQLFFFFISYCCCCCCLFSSSQIKYTERIIGNTGRSSTSISQQNLSHFALAQESLDTFGQTYRIHIPFIEYTSFHKRFLFNAGESLVYCFHSFTFGLLVYDVQSSPFIFFSSFSFIYSNLSCFYKLCWDLNVCVRVCMLCIIHFLLIVRLFV